ncbi:MAG: hypothetical protein GXP46_01780 [Deferribacteres bacterium]|nr:hypothetical protein [Deferribacteres bacterium]
MQLLLDMLPQSYWEDIAKLYRARYATRFTDEEIIRKAKEVYVLFQKRPDGGTHHRPGDMPRGRWFLSRIFDALDHGLEGCS